MLYTKIEDKKHTNDKWEIDGTNTMSWKMGVLRLIKLHLKFFSYMFRPSTQKNVDENATKLRISNKIHDSGYVYG